MLKPSITKLTLSQTAIARNGTSPRHVDRIPAGLTQRRKSSKRHFVDARREQTAIEHVLTLPGDSESVHLVIDGRFEPCDLIPAVRRLSDPATIRELTVTTLSFNSDNIACIIAGIDQQKIGTSTVICSDYFAKAEQPLFELARQELEQRGSRLFGRRVHCKLILMEMTDGRHFTVEGSGNLRSCKSIEQLCITNDRDLLQFHRQWIEDYVENGRRTR